MTTTRTPVTATGQSLADGEEDGLTALIVQIEVEAQTRLLEHLETAFLNSPTHKYRELERARERLERGEPVTTERITR